MSGGVWAGGSAGPVTRARRALGDIRMLARLSDDSGDAHGGWLATIDGVRACASLDSLLQITASTTPLQEAGRTHCSTIPHHHHRTVGRTTNSQRLTFTTSERTGLTGTLRD